MSKQAVLVALGGAAALLHLPVLAQPVLGSPDVSALYAIKSVAESGSHHRTYLLKIHPPAVAVPSFDGSTPTASALGNTDDAAPNRSATPLWLVTTADSSQYTDGLAIHSDGALYAFRHPNTTNTQLAVNSAGAGAQLVRIDQGSVNGGRITMVDVGSLMGGAIITGAAFDRQDRLWALNTAPTPQQLLRIDPATGDVLETRHLTYEVSGGGLNDRLDFVNGTTRNTVVGSLLGDLAFDADDSAYVTGNSQAFSLDLSDTAPCVTAPAMTCTVLRQRSSVAGQQLSGLAFSRNFPNALVNYINGQDSVRYGDPTALPANAVTAAVVAMRRQFHEDTPNSGTSDLAAVPTRITAADDTVYAEVGGPSVVFDTRGNDSNLRAEPMTITALNPLPSGKGDVVIEAGGGGIRYTPGPGSATGDTFQYQVCTTRTNACTTATVVISLAAPPAVSLSCAPATLPDAPGQTAQCTAMASEPAPVGGLQVGLSVPGSLHGRYMVNCPSTLTIDEGALNSTIPCTVTATVNTIAGDGNVDVTLALAAAAHNYAVGAPAAATVTVVDDDAVGPDATTQAVPAFGPWGFVLSVLGIGGLGWLRRRA